MDLKSVTPGGRMIEAIMPSLAISFAIGLVTGIIIGNMATRMRTYEAFSHSIAVDEGLVTKYGREVHVHSGGAGKYIVEFLYPGEDHEQKK